MIFHILTAQVAIFQEYVRAGNKFIDYFWENPEIISKAQLKASIYRKVDSWFTADIVIHVYDYLAQT